MEVSFLYASVLIVYRSLEKHKQQSGFFYGQRYSVIKITNSLVKLNNGGFYGGGLHLYGDSVATIERSTLSSNRAGYGGAINVDVHSKINATSSFLTANQGMFV